MKEFFVPYVGAKPKPININGHRVIILAEAKDAIEDQLLFLGADTVKCIKTGDSVEEQAVALNKLAKRINAGVVVSPDDITLRDLMRNLEEQLPWLQ